MTTEQNDKRRIAKEKHLARQQRYRKRQAAKGIQQFVGDARPNVHPILRQICQQSVAGTPVEQILANLAAAEAEKPATPPAPSPEKRPPATPE